MTTTSLAPQAAVKNGGANAPAGKPERAVLIDHLCATLGTEYRDLRQYRSL